jgi:hypothetical protein
MVVLTDSERHLLERLAAEGKRTRLALGELQVAKHLGENLRDYASGLNTACSHFTSIAFQMPRPGDFSLRVR